MPMQFFFSILCSSEWGFIYTFVCASMLSLTMAFHVVKKRVRQVIFYNSSGTLMWVRIIPVKVESGLTAIFRTFANISAPLDFRHKLNWEWPPLRTISLKKIVSI